MGVPACGAAQQCADGSGDRGVCLWSGGGGSWKTGCFSLLYSTVTSLKISETGTLKISIISIKYLDTMQIFNHSNVGCISDAHLVVIVGVTSNNFNFTMHCCLKILINTGALIFHASVLIYLKYFV